MFSHSDYKNHEVVTFHYDEASGLKAIIAVHNTNLGQALGGCRMRPYASEAEALTDALRLSQGMTYKAAMAGLPRGGGKSVIIGDPEKDKTPAMMKAMGRFVDSLRGKYVVAEDSGTTVADIRLMAEETKHIGGLADEAAALSGRTGDPSPTTALGTFYGIQAAVRHRLGRDHLRGLRVAIQGAGSVGYHLSRHLHAAGAKLWVTDVHRPAIDRCVSEFGAIPVDPDSIYSLDVDVFSPCALGATLNDTTIAQLKAPIVAGAANDQLEKPAHGRLLHQRKILYAPDYVINAGGLIDVFYGGRPQWDQIEVDAHLRNIAHTLSQIFERSDLESCPTSEIADEMAAEIVNAETQILLSDSYYSRRTR